LKDWIEAANYLCLPSDHHAVTALKAPYATAGAHVHIVDLFCKQFFCTAQIIDVIRIAPVDDRVAGVQMRCQVSDGFVYHCGRDH
jgi:hypothetical protein